MLKMLKLFINNIKPRQNQLSQLGKIYKTNKCFKEMNNISRLKNKWEKLLSIINQNQI